MFRLMVTRFIEKINSRSPPGLVFSVVCLVWNRQRHLFVANLHSLLIYSPTQLSSIDTIRMTTKMKDAQPQGLATTNAACLTFRSPHYQSVRDWTVSIQCPLA